MTLRRTALVVAALALAACGRPDQEFINGTPDFNALSLEITGDTSEGVALVNPDRGGLGQTQSAVGSASAYLVGARSTVQGLNGALRAILTPVVSLINSEDPTAPQADLRVYGPKDTEVATFRLAIKRITAERYGWKLEAKPLGAEDTAYVPVIAGWMTKGETAHRGRGVIGIDLDAYKTIDTAFAGQGKLLSAFAHVGHNKVLAYRLDAFTPDTAARSPLTAAFVGYRKVDTGFTAIRLGSWTNIDQTPTLAPELILTRLRHKIGVGGRADIVAFKGDVPTGTFYWGTGCWNAAEEETFQILRVCTTTISTGTCTVVPGTTPIGTINLCHADVSQEPPAADENSSTMESGSPDSTVDAPLAFPTMEGA